MPQHSVKVDEYTQPPAPRPRRAQFAGFSSHEMSMLADEINVWLAENPDAQIVSIHHAATEGSTNAPNDRWPLYTALLEVRR